MRFPFADIQNINRRRGFIIKCDTYIAIVCTGKTNGFHRKGLPLIIQSIYVALTDEIEPYLLVVAAFYGICLVRCRIGYFKYIILFFLLLGIVDQNGFRTVCRIELPVVRYRSKIRSFGTFCFYQIGDIITILVFDTKHTCVMTYPATELLRYGND